MLLRFGGQPALFFPLSTPKFKSRPGPSDYAASKGSPHSSVDVRACMEQVRALLDDAVLGKAQRSALLVLDRAGSGARLAEAAVEHVFRFAPPASAFTVSLVQIRRGVEEPEDLLGSRLGSISGISVHSVQEACDAMHVRSMGPDMVASLTIRPLLTRVHVVCVHTPGLWTNAVGLPARLQARCQAIMLLGHVASAALEDEWLVVHGQQPACIERPTAVASTEANAELIAARRRIAALELELHEAKERIALRENTLVNILLGSHPAFSGLDDTVAARSVKKTRQSARDKENDGANTVSFAGSACAIAAPGGDGVEPALKRLGSATGAPLRVVKTPGCAGGKTKSRVF